MFAFAALSPPPPSSSSSFLPFQETFSIYIFFLHNLNFCFHFLDAPLPPLSLQIHCPYSASPFPPSPHPLYLLLTPFTSSSLPLPPPHALYLLLTPCISPSLGISAIPLLLCLQLPDFSRWLFSPSTFSFLSSKFLQSCPIASSSLAFFFSI